MPIKGQTSQEGQSLDAEQAMNNHHNPHDTQEATGSQALHTKEMSDDDKLTYDWETSETLRTVKTFPISDYGTNSDAQTSDEFMVPEPPSLSGIIDGTNISSSSSSTTTDVEENFVEDDMSSLTIISDIEVGDAPRRHEFAKERVDRKGSVYDKLYKACRMGQLSAVKEILENHTTVVLTQDENGQTPLFAACIGNHPETIML